MCIKATLRGSTEEAVEWVECLLNLAYTGVYLNSRSLAAGANLTYTRPQAEPEIEGACQPIFWKGEVPVLLISYERSAIHSGAWPADFLLKSYRVEAWSCLIGS